VNNIIPWRDEMHAAMSQSYKLSGTFFITSERHIPQPLIEAEYFNMNMKLLNEKFVVFY
jgi:hypothetical protein